jgi:hypothetical protein
MPNPGSARASKKQRANKSTQLAKKDATPPTKYTGEGVVIKKTPPHIKDINSAIKALESGEDPLVFLMNERVSSIRDHLKKNLSQEHYKEFLSMIEEAMSQQIFSSPVMRN